jgi:hypothetical protein
MRAVLFLAFFAVSTLIVAGQDSQSVQPSPATAAPATVIKHSWAKERINWESDPFAGPVESFEDMRRRSVDTRRIERARGSGNMAEAAKVEQEMRAERVIKASHPPKPARYAFVYKVSIQNNSEKAIKEFDWDYVFFDAVTGAEVGRRQFTGVEKINPGKSKELVFQVSSPPTRTISVYALDKNERRGLTESVILVRITYVDGSVWPSL